MTKTEHEYCLHVCPLCGRVEVYSQDSEGRTCKRTIEGKQIGVECQGKWVSSKLTPEENIYDKAGSPSKALENEGKYKDSPKASWELE